MALSEANIKRTKLALRGMLSWGLLGVIAGIAIGILFAIADGAGLRRMIDYGSESAFWLGLLGVLGSLVRDLARWAYTD